MFDFFRLFAKSKFLKRNFNKLLSIEKITDLRKFFISMIIIICYIYFIRVFDDKKCVMYYISGKM